MAAKSAKKSYKDEPENLAFSTTVFAVIGTIIYALIAYIFYRSYVNFVDVIIFFVVAWIVYYIIVRKVARKDYSK